MLSDKVTYVKFNGRVPMGINLRKGIISSKDPTINQEKKDLYQFLALQNIPYIQLKPLVNQIPASIAEIYKYTTLRLSIPKPIFSEDYELLTTLDWLLDAFQFNKDDDIRYEFLKDKKQKKEESYVYIRMGSFVDNDGNLVESFEDNKIYVTKVNDQWDKITNLNDITNLLNNLTKKYRTDLILCATNWSKYITNALYKHENSLLLSPPPLSKRRPYDVIPVGFDKRSREQWTNLLVQYRIENPTTELNSVNFLPDRPHDYELLDEKTLSFVALDHKTQKMIGYIVCTLRSLNNRKRVMRGNDFQCSLLNDFAGGLAVYGEERLQNAGYDVFSIDGIHVHKDYRSIPGLTPVSKVMVFHALEFIRLKRRDLGVTLVMAGAVAKATKAILCGSFGFKHFNCINVMYWLERHMIDYYEQRSGEKFTHQDRPEDLDRTTSETLIHLLSRKRLITEVKEIQQTYGAQLNRTNKMKLVNGGLQEIIVLLQDRLEVSPTESILNPTDPINKDTDWPVNFIKPPAFKDLIVKVGVYKTYIEDDARLGKTHLTKVAVFLDTAPDPQDTFLHLAEGGGEQVVLFEKKLLQFYENTYSEGSVIMEEEWDHDEVFSISTIPVPNTSIMTMEKIFSFLVDDSNELTEKDVILYNLWKESDELMEVEDEVIPKSTQPSTKTTTQHNEPVRNPPNQQTPTTVKQPKKNDNTPLLSIQKEYFDAKKDHDTYMATLFQEEMRKRVVSLGPPKNLDDQYMRSKCVIAYLDTIYGKKGKSYHFPIPKIWIQTNYPGYFQYFKFT